MMTGRDSGRSGRQHANEALLAEHEERLRRFSRDLPYQQRLVWTRDSAAKPAATFTTPPPMQQCLPIHVSNLVPGTTHRGRLLRGRVAVQSPIVAASIQLLVEDELGDLAKLSVYNMLDHPGGGEVAPQQAFLQAQAWAQRMFQPGRCLAVLEPYFKIQADGTPGVRVDNPQEVVFLDSLGPSTPGAWQQEGGRHFAAQQYGEASRCFSLALSTLCAECEGVLCALLLNLSAAARQLGSGGEALLWAAAAHAVDPASGKAMYRCASALDLLRLRPGGLWAVSEAARLGAFGGGPDAEQQMCTHMTSLRRKPKGGRQGGEGSREQAVRVLGAAQGAAPAAPVESSGGGGGAEAAKEAKERGNALFRAGDYAGAVQEYLQALGQVPGREQAAVLLSNRAACHLKGGVPPPGVEGAGGPDGRLMDAVVDASAAATLAPALVKAHFRRGSALLQLEWLPEAGAAVRQALRCVPGRDRAALLELQSRIESATGSGARLAAEGGGGGWAGGARARQLSEGEVHAMQEAACMDAPSVAAMNAMMQAMEMGNPGAARKVVQGLGLRGSSVLDNRVAPIHQEFAEEGRWPPQCDAQRCAAELRSAYEHAWGMRMHEMALSADSGPLHERVQPLDLLKRLGCLEDERVDWLLAAPMGDISFRRSGPYNCSIFHSFSNVPSHREPLLPGSTHVAVGFVDLGGLAEACMQWGPMEGAEAGAAPLRWVGYEASAYAVAKTLVLVQMLQEGAETDHVLQVWYSAAWSRAALAAFRRALMAVLRSSAGSAGSGAGAATSTGGRGGGAGSADPASVEVLALLRCWQLHDVPLAQSRRHWIKGVSQTCAYICNFKSKVDRLALCRYALTGQLLEAEVGSVVMCYTPEGPAKRSLDESVLQTIHSHELFQAMLEDPQLDVMAAAVARLRTRIRCLARLVGTSRVQVTLHHQAVNPGDRHLHACIRALSPHTISWSNVPDYCGQPRAFHSMARACSAPRGSAPPCGRGAPPCSAPPCSSPSCSAPSCSSPPCSSPSCSAPRSTVHHLQSMNWPMDVKGACHLDMMLTGVPGKAIIQLLRQSEETVACVYQAEGWDRLLLSPPVDNPRNILDFNLELLHYEAWVAAFFREAGLQDVSRQSLLLEPPLYSVLGRTSSTLGMAYTFDPDVDLRACSSSLGHA